VTFEGHNKSRIFNETTEYYITASFLFSFYDYVTEHFLVGSVGWLTYIHSDKLCGG